MCTILAGPPGVVAFVVVADSDDMEHTAPGSAAGRTSESLSPGSERGNATRCTGAIFGAGETADIGGHAESSGVEDTPAQKLSCDLGRGRYRLGVIGSRLTGSGLT